MLSSKFRGGQGETLSSGLSSTSPLRVLIILPPIPRFRLYPLIELVLTAGEPIVEAVLLFEVGFEPVGVGRGFDIWQIYVSDWRAQTWCYAVTNAAPSESSLW
jgi:hypothetical protein